MPRRTALLTSGMTAVALALAACSTGGDAGEATGDGAAAAFPLTLTSCEVDVTVEAPPERVVVLKNASVPYLRELDVLDRVVARAGAYPPGYYDEQTTALLEDSELLTDRTDTTGHTLISAEEVVGLEPDLVLGALDNLDQTSMGALGVPLMEEPALCPRGVAEPTFADVEDQLLTYATVFDREELGRERADALRERVEAATEQATSGNGEPRTAAMLFPTVGGGSLYAYGIRSMAHPQLEAAGLTNVFADTDERVFEIGVEELLGRDPDVLVLLHSEGDPEPVEQAVTSLPGAENLTAVQDGEILVQLFSFTEPPSPLSVEGLERLVERFGP